MGHKRVSQQPTAPHGLTLTRAKGQAIMIGNEVCVRVVSVRDGRAKLQITAPKSTSIMREEIYDALKLVGGEIGGPQPSCANHGATV